MFGLSLGIMRHAIFYGVISLINYAYFYL